MEAIGRTRWALAEGIYSAGKPRAGPQMISHETLCLLNTSDNDADVRITRLLCGSRAGRTLSGPVPARRTKHLRFNELWRIPLRFRAIRIYASVVESNIPIVVQQTRLDSRQAENALFSTVAFPA